MVERLHLDVFDFDGTLTRRDTFIGFIRYVHGTKAAMLGFAKYAPLYALMKMGIISNGKFKRMLFTHYFAGMQAETFEVWCRRYADSNSGSLLRPKGMKAVGDALTAGHDVLIVSASIGTWVQSFFDDVISGHGGELSVEAADGRHRSRLNFVCTAAEVADGKLTGRFAGKNCYGTEKLRRVKELYPDRKSLFLTVYGDSRGDIALLDASDEGYYKPFRR